ncbi:hypothetical protein PSHT_11011 [Puccinia striiformis]|uniref:Uncharacterized protein n=1 Tax=Puccinia striiformis TaxID=27350 RepID=A0A2S4V615_9BASI|nr:hypothetical protein PSHT_11011 [Puccinia striiformis]
MFFIEWRSYPALHTPQADLTAHPSDHSPEKTKSSFFEHVEIESKGHTGTPATRAPKDLTNMERHEINQPHPRALHPRFPQKRAYRSQHCRAMWGAPDGWNSTRTVLDHIRGVVCNNGIEGIDNWRNYILEEAKGYVTSEGPKSHDPREGVTWFSANTVEPSFFSPESRAARDQHLTTTGSPFLYQLLRSKLGRNVEDTLDEDRVELSEDLCDLIDLEGDTLPHGPASEGTRRERRAVSVALGACSMTGFVCNRRDNGLQLANAVTLLACGVTERVNSYFHWLGLASSRKTALMALASLGRFAKQKIIHKIKSAGALRPLICIDNIDFVFESIYFLVSRTMDGIWLDLGASSVRLSSWPSPKRLNPI